MNHHNQRRHRDLLRGPHGMCTTQKDEVNEDLLRFIRGKLERGLVLPKRTPRYPIGTIIGEEDIQWM